MPEIGNVEREEMRKNLLKFVKEDPRVVDITWSLFVAAVESYKFDSLVRPFPKTYVDETGTKLIDELRTTISESSSVQNMAAQLEENTLSEKLLHLLYWLLIDNTSYSLRSLTKQQMVEVIGRVGGCTIAPHHMFEVTMNTASSQRCGEMAERLGSRLAYHGSRVENFYSILHHGLQLALNKTAAFGTGIYLSTDMSVSLLYSPTGLGWSLSRFGSVISLIAVSQVVDHPDVKSNEEKGSGVPRKYLLAQNSDMVCVRYLMLYTTQPALGITAPAGLKPGGMGGVVIFLCFFVLVLFVVIYKQAMTIS